MQFGNSLISFFQGFSSIWTSEGPQGQELSSSSSTTKRMGHQDVADGRGDARLPELQGSIADAGRACCSSDVALLLGGGALCSRSLGDTQLRVIAIVRASGLLSYSPPNSSTSGRKTMCILPLWGIILCILVVIFGTQVSVLEILHVSDEAGQNTRPIL